MTQSKQTKSGAAADVPARVAKPTPAQAAELVDAAEAFEQTYAEDIAARVAAGLTYQQAVTVQRAQVREDAKRN